MKLITTQKELEVEFKRLINQYNQFYWVTAWAGESTMLDELISHKSKIMKITVGIHFYQTHPNFIKEFLGDNRVRFIQQPDGTFHPKLYLFFNADDNWEILIGSANFTSPAFNKNTEATVLLTSQDNNSKDIIKESIILIESSWESAKVFNEDELDNYFITWKNLRPKINSLSGLYGSKDKSPRPIHQVPIINRNWKEYMDDVRKDKYHSLDNRIKVIEIARNIYSRTNHFHLLNEDERRFIAGIQNKLNITGSENWAFFGSMAGAGIFMNKIINNDLNVSYALDHIPISGQITKSHYTNFIKLFAKTFKGDYIATATRLLSMKRPDTFICFASKNKKALCKDFGIKQSDMNYERYWDDVIERIYDCEWWQNPNPINEQETKVSEARASFLDSIYYVK
ncbi:MAG: phospholipase D family protein [Ignavibacteria bacterium]